MGNDRIVVVTTRDRIRGVAELWRHQYCNGVPSHFAHVQDALDALDKDTATADDVAAIIGNSSWTNLTCGVCECDVEKVVRLGDPERIDSDPLLVCGDCLSQATVAFHGE